MISRLKGFNCTIMELKSLSGWLGFTFSISFNCTIMELKSQLYSISDIQRVSFNCTILELKFMELKYIYK